ncbi:UM00103-like protein [Dacryopinax primogenitus]|uniref:UM00103-like protein n=1 Tax=Dacryopinax primogenitus (strain DJM 731) TaxID=1858805 RepID=M5G1C5_DACPD|nr:UM00103-like protein [Dacryopinax primogenitus]EJU01995.1 UM00103-like protein [Dacryopinax primogenitus]
MVTPIISWEDDKTVVAVVKPEEGRGPDEVVPVAVGKEEEEEKEPPLTAPDGGYGWIVAICQFLCNAATFGNVTSFGVFLSFYRENNYFPGTTDIQYAFVGGVIVAVALVISPLSNYLGNRFGFRAPMIGGVLLYTASQFAAAFSRTFWELLLSQGIATGLGIGLIFIPLLPILAQWFTKCRALALGIAAGGSGGGSLVFSIVTRASIESLGLRWAFIVNALVCFVVLVPAVLLIRDRSHLGSKHNTEPLELKWLAHPGFVWVWLWALFALMGYVFGVLSVPTYAVSGLGLTQTQGANLQAILAAGQMVGRPAIGLVADRIGRINAAMTFTFVAGFSCLVIWMLAHSYSVLILFSILQGLTGGTFWGACAPVTAEIVGVKDMGSAMAMLWLVSVVPNLVSEPIGIALVNYSQQLGMQGTDAYRIGIGFTGACFVVGSMTLLGTKRYVQGNWRIWQRS